MTKRSKKQLPNIEVPHWVMWLVASSLVGFVGGFFISYFGEPRCDYFSCYYSPVWIYLGWGFLLIAVVFDILAFKDLIAEAHIKALEVFYGQKRAIANPWTEPLPTSPAPKQINTKKTKRLTYTIDDDVL